MTSDVFGSFLTYLPTHIRFSPYVEPVLNKEYPIFINLPTYPKIGYHMWMTPKPIQDKIVKSLYLI